MVYYDLPSLTNNVGVYFADQDASGPTTTTKNNTHHHNYPTTQKINSPSTLISATNTGTNTTIKTQNTTVHTIKTANCLTTHNYQHYKHHFSHHNLHCERYQEHHNQHPHHHHHHQAQECEPREDGIKKKYMEKKGEEENSGYVLFTVRRTPHVTIFPPLVLPRSGPLFRFVLLCVFFGFGFFSGLVFHGGAYPLLLSPRSRFPIKRWMGGNY